ERHHQMLVARANDRADGANAEMLAYDRIAGLVRANRAGQRLPASYVVPGEWRFDHHYRLIVLHHRKIDRLAADRRKFSVTNLGELRLADVVLNHLQMIADRRLVFLQRVQNGPRLPYKNPAVPVKA